MSAAGGVLNRIVGSLGGTQTAAVLVIGGIVVGGASGGALSSGAFSGSPATAGGELSVYPCPDLGPALFTVPGGQKFLVTGKTGDGTWLRIHSPLPGRTEAWVQANPLTLNGSLADIPVAECAPELTILASPMPEPTLTAIQNNSPSPSPTPVPTATPVPNSRPSLSALTASTNKISYDTGSYCPNAVKKVTFKVKATDTSGVEAVTLFWREPGAAGYAQSAMSRTAGTAKSGTWQVTLDTTANGITKAGKLAFYAVATDTAGATRRLPTNGTNSITVAVCENTGPTIKSAASSAGKTLYQVTRTAPNCRSSTTISATVTDVDGVDTVTLFFRPPGESTYRSRPMTRAGTKWSAPIDTVGDKITIPNPPTGNLRWYIKAVDKTGLTSQTNAATITIKRCDTEASFPEGPSTQGPFCSTRPISFFGAASDPDGINGSSAVLVYRYVATDGTSRTRRAQMTGTRDGPWYYSVTFQPPANVANDRSKTMTYYIETTDQFGGTSESNSAKLAQGC